jgi:arsenate reductase (glutaredoxin)
MRATIWHNPNCGTSRKTLEILRGTPGVDVEVIEYLKHPPTRDRLAALYEKAGMTPRQGLRAKQDEAKPLLEASDDAILDAMMANPILIERPLVETEKGVRLCRPQDRVKEIL